MQILVTICRNIEKLCSSPWRCAPALLQILYEWTQCSVTSKVEGLHFCEVHLSDVQQRWWVLNGRNVSSTALTWFTHFVYPYIIYMYIYISNQKKEVKVSLLETFRKFKKFQKLDLGTQSYMQNTFTIFNLTLFNFLTLKITFKGIFISMWRQGIGSSTQELVTYTCFDNKILILSQIFCLTNCFLCFLIFWASHSNKGSISLYALN